MIDSDDITELCLLPASLTSENFIAEAGFKAVFSIQQFKNP